MRAPRRVSAKIGSKLKRGIKTCCKLGEKGICILDDIPFVLKNVLPKTYNSLGSFMLSGAGFIIFPFELIEGIVAFRKAYRKPRLNPSRKFLMQSNTAKICAAISGVGISCSLLAFTAASYVVAGAIASILIPATVTVISGIELKQKSYKYNQAKMSNNAQEIVNAERKLGFGATYFTFSLAVTSLAIISTLSSLGVLSLGIIPSAILITTVVIALAVKIFELLDKKYNYKFTNALTSLFKDSDSSDQHTLLRSQSFSQKTNSNVTSSSLYFRTNKKTVTAEDALDEPQRMSIRLGYSS